MKSYITTFFMCIFLVGFSQEKNSNKEKTPLSQIINYNLTKSNSQKSNLGSKKSLGRWLFNNKSRLNITSDKEYDLSYYSKAFREYVASDLYCNEDDVADWKNIGPKGVNQENGWVSAVYINPSDPMNATEPKKILIGARIAGIFMTEDHGNTWRCVTDNLPFPVLGIKQLVASPYDPNHIIAIMGTTTNSFALDTIQNGYLISTDGGEQWSLGSNTLQNSGILNQLEWIDFYKNANNNQNIAFGVTNNQVVISYDKGVTWSSSNLPPNYNDTDKKFTKILISGHKIHATAHDKHLNVARYWEGNIEETGGQFSIAWGSENSAQFAGATKGIVSNVRPFMQSIFLPYQAPYQSAPNTFHHSSINLNCGPGTINWHQIITPGWTREDHNGVFKIFCNYSNSGTNNKEVITHTSNTFPSALRLLPNVIAKVKARIPKGVKLKIAISPYAVPYPISSTNVNWSRCTLPDYNYNYNDNNTGKPGIFDNIVFDSGFASNDLDGTINNSIGYLNFDQMNFPGITEFPIGNSVYYHFILEFNDDYDHANLPRFRLDKFTIEQEVVRPYMLNFSNDVNGKFYVHSIGPEFDAIFKHEPNTNSFNKLVDDLAPTDSGRYGKDLFVASLSEPDVLYWGSVDQVKRYKDADLPAEDATFDSGNGHHDDYRASYIVQLAGTNKDYLLVGNDGGVAEIPDANIDNTINSLNGDNLAINMIYNLDVHEKTNKILIGLQDNSTKVFFEDQLGFSNADGQQTSIHDGSITMIQEDHPNQYVFGDPQLTGSGALKDNSNANGIVNEGQINILDKGGAFLGMRLEEYRFHPDRFIVGYKNHDSSPYGYVIMNTAANDPERQIIEESLVIESIAICHRNEDVVYAADGVWKGENENAGKPKIFKTEDNGQTWKGLKPTLSFPQINNDIIQFNDFAPYEFVNALGVDPVDSQRVYAGMSGIGRIKNPSTNLFDVVNEYFRVLLSVNGGEHFEDWSQGLPALPVNYLLPIESESQLVFCATDAGVYYRTNTMSKWECFSNNLAKTRITDLSFNYCSKELYASTYGRGVWKTPVNIYLGTKINNEITSNTVWNTDQYIQENILIKSGATLTINGTVFMDADRKIMIEPGAQLVVDGGKITNYCGQYWRGIEVWGNSNLNQSPSNQGRLITKNNAIIEYAEEAIQVWKKNDWTSTGGYLNLKDTQFRNNRISVFFYPYHNNGTGNEIMNASSISNCEFLWDDEYIDKRPLAAITLYNINGVRISGCDFKDSRATITSDDSRANGIYSLDAGFRIEAKTPINPEIHHEFSTSGGYDTNNFINLNEGIKVTNANAIYTSYIDHCSFENSIYPIKVISADNITVTRNLFNLNTSRPADINALSAGIYLRNSKGFTIEGNTHISNDTSSFSLGVLAWDTGIENNTIYRNKFVNQTYGSYAYGINGQAIPQSVIKGLQWICNDFSNCKNDIIINGTSNYEAHLFQGTNQKPAGNKFTEEDASLANLNLGFTGTNSLNYYYNSANSQEEPILLNGNINKISSNQNNKCESSFNAPKKGQIKEKIRILHRELHDIDAQIAVKSNAIKSEANKNHELNEETENTLKTISHLYVARTSKIDELIKIELLSNSIDFQNLNDLINKRNNHSNYLENIENALSFNKKETCEKTLDILTKHVELVDNQYLKQELADYIKFKKYIFKITNYSGIVQTLNNDEVESLRKFANNNTGISSIQAQNILCFLKNECNFESLDLIDLIGNKTSQKDNKSDVLKDEVSIKVIPNPNKGSFLITSKEHIIKDVKIYNQLGRELKVKKSIVSKNKVAVELQQVSSGIYYAKVILDTNESYSLKVLIE